MAKTFSYISPPFRLVASAACKKARLYSSMSRKVRKAFRQRTFDPSRRTTTGCSRSERALGTLLSTFPRACSFFVIQRFSIGADLHFRSFAVGHDLCFVCHKFALLC